MKKSLLFPVTNDPLSELINSYRFKVTSIGALIMSSEQIPGKQNPFHMHRLIYIISGSVNVQIGVKINHFEKNHVIYLAPGCTILNADPASDLQFYYIDFEMQNLTSLINFNHMINQYFIEYAIDDKDLFFLNRFNELFRHSTRSADGNYLLIQSLFNVLLIELLQNSQYEIINSFTHQNEATIYLYNQAVTYIYNNLNSTVKISDLANQLGISTTYLYKLFKKHAGESPQNFIQTIRLETAKNYLKIPDYTIKMIADQLGFTNSSHFSLLFKKKYGISPNEYRNKHIK